MSGAHAQQGSSSHSTGTSLLDLAMPIVRLLGDLQPSQADAGLRQRMEDLFRDFETRALRLGNSQGDTQAAKYALSALVDESILLSDLPLKDEWMGLPLQQLYFDDVSAGEEFYNRLEQLRLQRGERTVQVLEVYHLCLAFGFKGKYGTPKGKERLQVIMEGLAQDIAQGRGVAGKVALSPQAMVADAVPMAPKALARFIRGPVWMVPVATLVAVVAIWLLFDLVTEASLASFTSTVHGGAAP